MNTKNLFKVGSIVFVNGTGFGQIVSINGVLLEVRLADKDIMTINTNDEIVYSFNYDMFYKLFSGSNMTYDNIFEVLTYLEYEDANSLVRFESRNDDNDIYIAEQHEYTTSLEVYNLLKSSENRYFYNDGVTEKIERKRKELEDEVREDLMELISKEPSKNFYETLDTFDETLEEIIDSGLLGCETYVTSPALCDSLCIIGYTPEHVIMLDPNEYIGIDNNFTFINVEYRHLSLDNMERLIRLIEQN